MNKRLMLVIGPLTAACVYLVMKLWGWPAEAAFTASVTAICAVWWVTEAIPIPATSLIPLAAFPLSGVLDPSSVASAYGSPLVLLLMGGFILSTAMERSGAHRQIALRLVNLFGGSDFKRLVWGFMSASALLSMWISNTATTLMLLPIALAVLSYTKDEKSSVALLLGICYSASVGGIGTPIGTPPNLVFLNVYNENTGSEISFIRWMAWAMPVVLCVLPIIAWWLTRSLEQNVQVSVPKSVSWTIEQKRVLMVFGLTALAWITRKEPFGGWSDWLGLEHANDASVALTAVVLMFVIPSGDRVAKDRRLLDWEAANSIPWGMLFLFAGGIAIAKAFTSSGLAAGLAESLALITVLPLIIMMLFICLSVTFLTEIISNTAAAALLMPVLAVAASVAGVDPTLLMVPAAISASCAFMLPVATAPNAIIFSSGKVPITTMLKHGVVLNFLIGIVITLVCYLCLAL